jgi:teichoic acid transport system permease protein
VRAAASDALGHRVEDGAARPAAAAVTGGTGARAGRRTTERPIQLDLVSDVDQTAVGVVAAAPGGVPLADYATGFGLKPSAARPPLLDYVRVLWQRRHFVLAFASAKNVATFSEARLGQLWQVLTPLLNAAVYYLIFGLLLKTSRGVPNYQAFLVVGIFVFTYTQRSVLNGSRAISSNLGLIRALHFPRATLPFAYTILELQQLAASMIVMAAIVLLTGEPITLQWLLVVPALLFQTMFNIGASLVVARVGAKYTDVAQLLPFVLRTWLYLSGVFYSIKKVTAGAPHFVRVLLEANPGAVYIDLVRDALLHDHVAGPHTWFYAVFWGVVALAVGFVYFWRAEETYGRG